MIAQPEPLGIARMAMLETAELASYDRVLLVKAWDAALAWLNAQRLDAAMLVAGEATVDSGGTYEIGTEEVRLALTLTPGQADAVVDLARALHSRLPATKAALERGAISVEHARVVFRGTEACTDAECGLIEAGLLRSGALPAVGSRTDRSTSSPRESVRRQVLRVRGPEPDEDRARAAARRNVVDKHHRLLAVDTYEPTQAIRDWAMTKYTTCSTPGCANPATRCDLDHEKAHSQGGPTEADNLPPRCRFCHLLKTMGVTSIDTEEDEHGETRRVLRMPSGHSYPLADPPLTEQETVDDAVSSSWGSVQQDEDCPF